MYSGKIDPTGKTLLVISGGGCAHIENAIGCLQAIRDVRDVKFDLAFGTSAGALVGSIFMSKNQDGYALKELIANTPFEDWVKIKPWQAIKSIFGKSNYVADDTGLKQMLLDNITEEGASKTFVSVSEMTDDGLFVKAHSKPGYPKYVLASMSFQNIFPPVRIDGKLYADGGVNDNIPIPKYTDIAKYKHIYILVAPASPLLPTISKWSFLNKLFNIVDNTMNREMAQIDHLRLDEVPSITMLKPESYVESASFLGWSKDFEQIDASYDFAVDALIEESKLKEDPRQMLLDLQ